MQIVQKQKELRGEADTQDIEEVHHGRDKRISYLFHNLFDWALNGLRLELQQQSLSRLKKHKILIIVSHLRLRTMTLSRYLSVSCACHFKQSSLSYNK